MINNKKFGFVAIVGRPNVGKSTLLNHLIGEKLVITSRKPQTTRHNVIGLKVVNNAQIAYIDTPGMHKIDKSKNSVLNKYMNKNAKDAMGGVDLVILVIENVVLNDEDNFIIQRLKMLDKQIFVVFNKIDKLENINLLLPQMSLISTLLPQAKLFAVSALKSKGLAELENAIVEALPFGDFMYDEDQLTDKSSKFLAAEIVREKIMRQLGDEIPYQSVVDIAMFQISNNVIHIHANIFVEKDGQKKIIIGTKGDRLKIIGTSARLDMEKLFGAKVMLNLWVKVKQGWSEDIRIINNLAN